MTLDLSKGTKVKLILNIGHRVQHRSYSRSQSRKQLTLSLDLGLTPVIEALISRPATSDTPSLGARLKTTGIIFKYILQPIHSLILLHLPILNNNFDQQRISSGDWVSPIVWFNAPSISNNPTRLQQSPNHQRYPHCHSRSLFHHLPTPALPPAT